jgi:2-hydroxyacyl-CoA lyase 1
MHRSFRRYNLPMCIVPLFFNAGSYLFSFFRRYNLPVCVVVMNNGGIYGGDRREQRLRELAAAGLAAAGVPTDPAPTDFVPQSKYHLLMEAFGGKGVAVATADELQAALRQALESRRPTLINVAIDPQAGVESGNVHAFNAPKGGS